MPKRVLQGTVVSDKGEKKQENLNKALSGVKLGGRIDSSGRQEHVNQHIQQSWRRVGLLGPVERPLVDDADNEVSKDTLHEQDLRDELAPNVDVLLELEMVGHLQTDRERHLSYICWLD